MQMFLTTNIGIKMLWQLTQLSAVSAAFFSVTSSLDGVKDDQERQQNSSDWAPPPSVVPVTLSINFSCMMLFQIVGKLYRPPSLLSEDLSRV